MFTNKVAAWVGKRVTFYPTQVSFGPKKVDALRIYGSPDIAADIDVQARIGRKNFTATLHKMAPKNGAKSAPDPRITAAFGILGFTPEEQAGYLAERAGQDAAAILAGLNEEIDRRNNEDAA